MTTTCVDTDPVAQATEFADLVQSARRELPPIVNRARDPGFAGSRAEASMMVDFVDHQRGESKACNFEAWLAARQEAGTGSPGGQDAYYRPVGISDRFGSIDFLD